MIKKLELVMRFDGKISTSVHDIELRCMERLQLNQKIMCEIMLNNNTNSNEEVIRKDKTN